MSILEIIATHIWDDDYPLCQEARERVTQTRPKRFQEAYPRIWYRQVLHIRDLNNNYGACKFLLTQGEKYRIYYTDILLQAAKNGDYDVVERLSEMGITSRELYFYAAIGGNIEIVKDYVDSSRIKEVALEAARCNHTKLLDWCYDTMKSMNIELENSEVARCAAEGGHLDAVIKAIKNGARNYHTIAVAAAKSGNLAIIKYTEGKYKLYTSILIEAANNGHNNIIDYVSEKIDITKCIPTILCVAMKTGNTELFMKYITTKLINFCIKNIGWAARAGNLTIVKYLLERYTKPINDHIFGCLYCNKLPIVEFLYEKYGNDAMDPLILLEEALRSEDFRLLGYLHKRGCAIPVHKAVQIAENNNLKMIDFLVNNNLTTYEDIYCNYKEYECVAEYALFKLS